MGIEVAVGALIASAVISGGATAYSAVSARNDAKKGRNEAAARDAQARADVKAKEEAAAAAFMQKFNTSRRRGGASGGTILTASNSASTSTQGKTVLG